MESQSDVALELKGLTKVYPKRMFEDSHYSVQDLNLQLRAGQVTGFLGHNGAGKTTTIRCILGLIRLTAGEILYKGAPISSETVRNIGYLAEKNSLPQKLTPYETLSFHNNLGVDKLGKEELEARLRTLGLWDHRKKAVRQLSKGLAQRLAWGIATIHNPTFLILDEPFSGLDPLAREMMRNWIQKEQEKGTTILLCTHEVEYAEALCDNIVIIKQGSVVFDSTKEEKASQWRVLVTGKTDPMVYESYKEACDAMSKYISDGVEVSEFKKQFKDLTKYF